MYFSDLTIQYGKNEALHLLALKEVNAKEAPDMTQEEAIGLQDLDDAFVLAQAEETHFLKRRTKEIKLVQKLLQIH